MGERYNHVWKAFGICFWLLDLTNSMSKSDFDLLIRYKQLLTR